jgi:hypothetical protein
MKTCLITLLVATSASIHAFAQSLIAAPQKPNVIFILADDLGIGNVSCYGSDHYHTPNIDKLAAGGIRFTHGFTAALCGPSRALIMTGRYAFRNGSTNQGRVVWILLSLGTRFVFSVGRLVSWRCHIISSLLN